MNCIVCTNAIAENRYKLEDYFSEDLVESFVTDISDVITETGLPSVSAALVWRDSLLWAGALGYADPSIQRRADVGTLYKVGSTFKIVTATAILQLHEQSQLNLDDNICNFFDTHHDVLNCGAEYPITARHLLCHYSGLSGPTKTVEPWVPGDEFPLQDIFPHISRASTTGSQFLYCNECYGILGLLVEQVSDMSFQDYIVENIFVPAGCNTNHPITPISEDNIRIAVPHIFRDSKYQKTSTIRYISYPAGDIYLTAKDMVSVLGAHLNSGVVGTSTILDERSVSEIRTPQYDRIDYGMGIGVSVNDERTVIHHSGGTQGYSSLMFGEIESGIGLFVVTNAGGQSALRAIFGPSISVFNRLRGKTR